MSDWQSNLLNAVNAMEKFTAGVEALVADVVTEVSIGTIASVDRLVELSIEVSEEIAIEVTDLFTGVVTDVVASIPEPIKDALKDATTEFSTQTQAFLDTDLEAFLNTLLYPLTVDSLEDWINTNTSANPYAYGGVPVDPHPICADCIHFHGQAYNDVAFVCGMHPYGITEGQSDCGDREI